MEQKLLVLSDYLSDKLCCELYLKPEWYGPTRAHKDKWAKKAVRLARQAGANKITVLTSGNQGLALAVEASKHNVKCYICTEPTITPIYLELYKKYSAKVYIGKDEKDQYAKYEQLVSEGYFPLGVTYEERTNGKQMPAIDAYKVTAQEIVKSLGDAPDIIIFPTACADHPEGVLRGFTELFEKKKINAVPKFILARANVKDGGDATSIATDATTPYITDVIERSNGDFVFVNNREMHEAHREIIEIHGWDVELSSAASLAAAKKISESKLKNKTVVLMFTALADKTGI